MANLASSPQNIKRKYFRLITNKRKKTNRERERDEEKREKRTKEKKAEIKNE